MFLSCRQPSCRACKSAIDAEWYEVVSDEYERDPTQDWTRVALTCPSCGKRGTVMEVDDRAGVGLFARREFIFFANVESKSNDTAWLKEALGDVTIAVYTST